MNMLNTFYLICAMIMVESNGNHCAYNAKEKAAGCLQIRPIMVAEANRLGIEFTLADRWDCEKSAQLFIHMSVLKNKFTPESMARCWNGGPNGDKKESTLSYWRKVQKELLLLTNK